MASSLNLQIMYPTYRWKNPVNCWPTWHCDALTVGNTMTWLFQNYSPITRVCQQRVLLVLITFSIYKVIFHFIRFNFSYLVKKVNNLDSMNELVGGCTKSTSTLKRVLKFKTPFQKTVWPNYEEHKNLYNFGLRVLLLH